MAASRGTSRLKLKRRYRVISGRKVWQIHRSVGQEDTDTNRVKTVS